MLSVRVRTPMMLSLSPFGCVNVSDLWIATAMLAVVSIFHNLEYDVNHQSEKYINPLGALFADRIDIVLFTVDLNFFYVENMFLLGCHI